MAIAVYGMCLANKMLTSDRVIYEGKQNKINMTGDFTGKMYNVCMNLSYLKDEVHFITKFGSDNTAFELEQKLNQNLIFNYPIFVDEITPTVFYINDLEKQLSLSTITDTFEFKSCDNTFHHAIGSCNVGLIDTNNIKYIEKIFNRSPNIDWILTQTVTDENILSKCFGMIINRQQLLKLSSNSQSIDHTAKALILKGLNFIIITLDKEGVVYFDKNNSWHFPLNYNNHGNNFGMDESFIAGFTHEIAKRSQIKVAIQKGLLLSTVTLNSKEILPEEIKNTI